MCSGKAHGCRGQLRRRLYDEPHHRLLQRRRLPPCRLQPRLRRRLLGKVRDGAADPGETCEPSSATQPCPTSCDDGDACTTDSMVDSAPQCSAQCVHTPLSGITCRAVPQGWKLGALVGKGATWPGGASPAALMDGPSVVCSDGCSCSSPPSGTCSGNARATVSRANSACPASQSFSVDPTLPLSTQPIQCNGM